MVDLFLPIDLAIKVSGEIMKKLVVAFGLLLNFNVFAEYGLEGNATSLRRLLTRIDYLCVVFLSNQGTNKTPLSILGILHHKTKRHSG
jgi:hypothetical protein